MNRKIMKGLHDQASLQHQTNQFTAKRKRNTPPTNPNNRIVDISEIPEWAKTLHTQPNNDNQVDKWKAQKNITDISENKLNKKRQKIYKK